VAHMEQEELDAMFRVIENPVRRKIIKRLSQEPSYALQLSKELGLGQPLVAKHLAIMEAAGLVAASRESSPSGPKRRRYRLAKGISITMDIGPNLFIQRGADLRPVRGKGAADVTTSLERRVKEAAAHGDQRERLALLSEVLNDVDSRIAGVEEERTGLLAVRNLAMHEAAAAAVGIEGLDKRRVLFHVLDEHDMGVQSISEALNLREMSVRAILRELENFLGQYTE
jgi:predicted transcriptional regulator